MRRLEDALLDILAADHPQTVRGAFYQATVRGIVPKTETGYQAVGRVLRCLRESGQLPYNYIADNTRWMRKPTSYDSLHAALYDSWRCYRRSLWASQAVNVEVWCEKDALAGVLYEVTAEWDVPLMVTRGYSSLSFLYECATSIGASGKPTCIYQFGDYDPSGEDIARNVERRLRQYAPRAEIHFERVAVTPQQIEEWSLPTRPTKATDTRSKGFHGESVELDAIPGRTLKALVRECIERHVDGDILGRTQEIEEAERESLRCIVKAFACGAA
jgi:hypothetical protein